MFLIAQIVFGLAAVVMLAFWLLFFLVVKVRIADRGLEVRETSRFGFLLASWPHDEMRTYLADLEPEESRRPVNNFLRHARSVLRVLSVTYLALILIMIITGGKS